MQIDLIKPLVIDSVIQNGTKLNFQNKGNIWYVSGARKRKNKKYTISIYYSGTPVESLSPPWDGGFVWAKDSLNRLGFGGLHSIKVQACGIHVKICCMMNQTKELLFQ
jgi:hypothetical protein